MSSLHDKTGLTVLPRYQPRESEVGCAEHADPSCLCDVIVTERTPIIVNIPHKYHDVALNELGDDTVSSRNIHEFFQIVMGMHQLEGEMDGTFNARPITDKRWLIVSPAERMRLRMHAMADSNVEYAMMEVPHLEGHEYRMVRNAYTQMAGQYRARRLKRGNKPKAAALGTTSKPAPSAFAKAKAGRAWLAAKRSGGTPFHEGTITLEQWRAREGLT